MDREDQVKTDGVIHEVCPFCKFPVKLIRPHTGPLQAECRTHGRVPPIRSHVWNQDYGHSR